MKILLLITSSSEIISRFQSSISEEYIVLTADNLEKGADLIRAEQVNMVAVDTGISENVQSWLKRYRGVPNTLWIDTLWIGIVPRDISEEELYKYYEIFHEIISLPLSGERLKVAIEKAQERYEVLSELKHLKLISKSKLYNRENRERLTSQLSFEPLEKAVALSRTFTASLDLDRLINIFLDALIDVIGVSRVSLLLHSEEGGEYRIKGSRGLHPQLTSKFRLPADSAMVLWLSAKGRILRRDRIEGETEELYIKHKGILTRALREMEVLQSIISIPIMCDGKLLSILNLDSKITGEPYRNTEMEKIYILSNYFGRAIEDIYSYNRVCNQKDYIQKILERMGSGVITVNTREKIIIFNPKAEEILKKKATDLIGRSAESLPRPIASLIKETVREGKVYRKREIVSEEEGLCLEVDTYGLQDTDGSIIGGVALLEDISAKKELNKEKKRGESLQILNELVGRMAHELRNPLVAVRTFTQLMKDRYDDHEFKDFFYNTVTGEVEKLNNLIEKLIAFVHPIEYKFEIVDLAGVLDEGLESVLMGLNKTDFRIVKNYVPGVFRLKADNKQLSKAFSYIMQNSFNAMVSGGVLTIDVESLSRDAMLKVSVKDTGRGIPQEDIERVFDPFYTAPDKGVGLGLPLSQKIIEDHGGKVAMSSILDKGTTLTVLLPSIIRPASIGEEV